MSDKPKILAVDDEVFNLDILQNDLEEAGFEVIRAEDGVVAIEKLTETPDIDMIVLDRMMPRMNGMEVLTRLKADPKYRGIPVIMQTAAAQSGQILEGIQAGAYYYLAKPYNEEILIGIVQAALKDSQNMKEMQQEVRKHKKVMGLLDRASFHFRTLVEAKNLAYYIANCCPTPENTVLGLNELMINAVEHGNLNITYPEKTRLILEGKWEEEVEARLEKPEYDQKVATLTFEATGQYIIIMIKDQGQGFAWENYLEFCPERMTSPHGRGIAITKAMCFSDMEYLGSGNEVVCRIPLTSHYQTYTASTLLPFP